MISEVQISRIDYNTLCHYNNYILLRSHLPGIHLKIQLSHDLLKKSRRLNNFMPMNND